MEAERPPVPPRTNDAQAPRTAAPPPSHRYKLIIRRFVAFAAPTILGILMVIFHAMPAGMLREHGLDLGSSLPSLDISISISHSKLVTMESTHMKLLSSADSQLTLSRPSLVSNSTLAPGRTTSLRAKAQTTLSIVTDLGINGVEVTIEVAAKAKRSLRLGPWWVAVLDVDISCMGVTFTAPSDGEGSGDRMTLEGTVSCSLDIIPQR